MPRLCDRNEILQENGPGRLCACMGMAGFSQQVNIESKNGWVEGDEKVMRLGFWRCSVRVVEIAPVFDCQLSVKVEIWRYSCERRKIMWKELWSCDEGAVGRSRSRVDECYAWARPAKYQGNKWITRMSWCRKWGLSSRDWNEGH